MSCPPDKKKSGYLLWNWDSKKVNFYRIYPNVPKN